MIPNIIQRIKTTVLVCLFSMLTSGCISKSIVNLQTGNPFAEHTWSNKADKIEVPFTWYDGHIIIETSINGQAGLKLALDSGASATVLFETLRAKSMSLNVDTTLDLPGSTVNLINDAKVSVSGISIENLTIVHVPLEQSPLFNSFEDAYFDGAIGYDVLKQYVTKIDYQNQKVIFYKKHDLEKLSSDWLVLPIMIKGNIPYIEASLKNNNGQKVSQLFVLDTGAPDYIYINSQLVENVSFPEKHFVGNMKHFEGASQIKTGRLPYFEFANTEFSDVTSHDVGHFSDDYGVGLLGSGLLRKYDVIFDYQSEKIAFKKAKNTTLTTPIDRSGLNMEPHILGGVVIDVASRSGASKLSLLPGDIITHINHTAITEHNFDQLRALFSSKLAKLPICWQRAGSKQCGELVLFSRL